MIGEQGRGGTLETLLATVMFAKRKYLSRFRLEFCLSHIFHKELLFDLENEALFFRKPTNQIFGSELFQESEIFQKTFLFLQNNSFKKICIVFQKTTNSIPTLPENNCSQKMSIVFQKITNSFSLFQKITVPSLVLFPENNKSFPIIPENNSSQKINIVFQKTSR